MLVKDAVRRASQILNKLENPRMQAELIMCSVQCWQMHELYLAHDSELPEEKEEFFFEKIKQRKSRTPLQHITGEVGFMGRMFEAGPGALIPRPETESLYEIFIKKLNPAPKILLDIGTGSGVIAITLGLDYPETTVIASDISIEALILAKQNIKKHGTKNVFPVQTDLTEAYTQKGKIFDGIVANLPYIRTADIEDLEPEVRNGDPVIALDGGEDGLEYVRKLIDCAPGHLCEKGVIALELDSSQVDNISKNFEESGNWKEIRIEEDLSSTPRIVTAVRKRADKSM